MNPDEALADCSAVAIRAAFAADDDATIVQVRGDSMRPLLRDGDMLHLRPLAAGELRVGDIVAMENGPRLIVHRVVAINGSRVYTHGDRASAPDPPLLRSAVVGVVDRVRAPFGVWLPSPSGARLGIIVRNLGRAMRLVAGMRNAVLGRRLSE